MLTQGNVRWDDGARPLPAGPGGPTAEFDTHHRAGLKLGHMKMVAALDETGQVSAAAGLLNMSQPAASRLIAEIEDIVGAPICERKPRGIELTAYGAAIARRARSVLLELREADREIQELRSGRGGTVTVGSVTGPAVDLLVPAVRKMRDDFPNVDLNIQIETSSVLAQSLVSSQTDFIIARIPHDVDARLFEAHVLGTERLCLIVRRGHPLLASGRSVRVEDLGGYEWVLEPTGSFLRRRVEEMFLSAKAPLPDRILNTTSLLLAMITVTGSDAIAPMAVEVGRFMMAQEGLDGAVGVLPLEGDLNVQPYSLIKIKKRSLPPAAQILYRRILDLHAERERVG